MAYVYKQFTAQDKALIPFNAHKQYNFTSTNALTNSASYYSTRWTSESYDTYSTHPLSASVDTINTIKYNQIDKLYYRNYLTQIHDKLGPIEYIKQPRTLYEKANILSIPMGLYGNEIKPGSFYLSSSDYKIIDDKFGNLLISGTLVNHYPNNIQENVFRLDPIKGFKKYDLGVHDGYAVLRQAPSIVYSPGETQEGEDPGVTYYEEGIFEKSHWRRGKKIDANAPTTYTSRQENSWVGNFGNVLKYYPLDKDDSYFINNIYYRNVTFNTSSLGSTSHKFPKISLNSETGSLISSSHNERYNFNGDEDFSISFWIEPKGITLSGSVGNSAIQNGFVIGNYTNKLVDLKKRFIISKSKTKTIHPVWNISSSQDPQEAKSEIQFPYEIYMQSSSLYFDMSDGNTNKSISTQITGVYNNSFKPIHILSQNSGSVMQIYKDGSLQSSTTISFTDQTRNTADLYIGGNGANNNFDNSGGISTSIIGNSFIVGNYVSGSIDKHRYFNGDINNINIWSRAFNLTGSTNISQSINGSPYIGNIFYQNGFASITHPTYYSALNSTGVGNMMITGSTLSTNTTSNPFTIKSKINTLQFQGTHLIYEHEFQCTAQEHEFNGTTNISARKYKSHTNHQLANFTTSSLFKPHVTTIGLYDDNMELLVVGKLGSPIRMSDETDTTFVVRWDT